MKTLITIIALVLGSTVLHAQKDTLTNDQNEIVEIWDVVAVYKEGTDGRGNPRSYVSEMKGEIQNYDATTGLITFKGQDGRMYSFKSGDYKYFEYDKQFVKKAKKKAVLKPRKETEFEISAGFRATYINFNDSFSPDDYYAWSGGGNTDLPIALYVGVGKYLAREHYVGLNGEIALTSYGSSYFSGGLRYNYHYDGYKKNVAFYLPVEIDYFRANYDENYQVNDTVIDTSGGGISIYYPSDKKMEYTLSAVSLSLGQGFGFIMNNKHSLAIELSLIKYFPMGVKFKNLDRDAPDVKFSGSGMRLSLIYNL